MSAENQVVAPVADAAATAAAAALAATQATKTAPDASIPDPAAATPVAADVKIESTGDAALDVALSFFAKNGISQDNAALKHAAETGDFSLLRAELATKAAPGWEQHVVLAEDAAKRAANVQASSKKAAADLIVKHVGGEENWTAIREWAGKNATADERVQINAALNAGGMQAKAAAEYLASRWAKSGGAVKHPAPALKDGAKPAPGANGAALTPRAYAAAVEELSKKIGSNRIDSSPEYKALQARRRAWSA